MKLYYVGPNLTPDAPPEIARKVSLEAAEPIADLILGQFKPDGFNALLGLTVRTNRPGPPRVGSKWERFGIYGVSRFRSDSEVRDVLLEMGNCYGEEVTTSCEHFFCVRSMLSCRSVTYGYDGQAFLCLRTEDDPPFSPKPSIVLVREQTDLLIQTDYMDGVGRAQEA